MIRLLCLLLALLFPSCDSAVWGCLGKQNRTKVQSSPYPRPERSPEKRKNKRSKAWQSDWQPRFPRQRVCFGSSGLAAGCDHTQNWEQIFERCQHTLHSTLPHSPNCRGWENPLVQAFLWKEVERQGRVSLTTGMQYMTLGKSSIESVNSPEVKVHAYIWLNIQWTVTQFEKCWLFLLLCNVSGLCVCVREGAAYLKGCDVFQLDSASFILLADTHNGWLEDFTGLQYKHLESTRWACYCLSNCFALSTVEVMCVFLLGSGLWRRWVYRFAAAAPSRSLLCPVLEISPREVWQTDGRECTSPWWRRHTWETHVKLKLHDIKIIWDWD